MKRICDHPDCGNLEEGTSGKCGTHNKLRRKVDNIKLPDDPKPVKKVSAVMSKMLALYAPLKKKFIHGRWCGVHGRPCIPTDIHHCRGREGFADEKEIPLLLDTRFWLPVCRSAHKQIEENVTWAKANGYSEDRLTKRI